MADLTGSDCAVAQDCAAEQDCVAQQDSVALTSRTPEEIARAMHSDAGMKDLRNLLLSMGLHAVRETLKIAVLNFGLKGNAKKKAVRAISDLSPVTEMGCMRVDFFNKTTNKPGVAYLFLNRCSKNHDLNAQLDKIKLHVADDKWGDVLKSLSMLIYLGRNVYSQETRKNIDLIKNITGASTAEQLAEFVDYKIDPENTTLYIRADWPHRVGIYVRSEA